MGEMKGKTGATNGCCGYGADGMKTTGYDCIVIPGAEKQADGAAVAATKQCGRTKGLVTADDGANATVCSKSTPFNLQFLSDGFEIDTEAKKPGVGVRLKYIMDNTNLITMSSKCLLCKYVIIH